MNINDVELNYYLNGTNETRCLSLDKEQYDNLTKYMINEVEARGGNITVDKKLIFIANQII